MQRALDFLLRNTDIKQTAYLFFTGARLRSIIHKFKLSLRWEKKLKARYACRSRVVSQEASLIYVMEVYNPNINVSDTDIDNMLNSLMSWGQAKNF